LSTPLYVVLAQHQLLGREPVLVAIAELAVLPAVGLRDLLLFPQEQARLYRGAGTADRQRDLPVAEPIGLEPQYLSNLAHG
jgi:hypothetical protein